MKIAITTTQIPFLKGGAEYHAENLKKALQLFGHEAEIVTMPFIDSPLYRIEDHIIASRMMDIEWSWGGHIDLCIGLKFPAFYMPHPNKVIWVLHQHRAAYELFNSEYGNIFNDYEGNEIRKKIKNADDEYLKEAKRLYSNSKNVAQRLIKNNKLISNVLYHPCPDMEKFFCEKYGDYILMPSRINITKRQNLALKAMLYVKTKFKLVIVGSADNMEARSKFINEICEMNLENKVEYLDYVSQEKKIELYANARAVVFIPVDEDYGYITLEAMAASKPVITAKDSGGPLEFVIDGETGIVVDPSAQSIAGAFDLFFNDSNSAERMGQAGKRRLDNMHISWENVVKELTK